MTTLMRLRFIPHTRNSGKSFKGKKSFTKSKWSLMICSNLTLLVREVRKTSPKIFMKVRKSMNLLIPSKILLIEELMIDQFPTTHKKRMNSFSSQIQVYHRTKSYYPNQSIMNTNSQKHKDPHKNQPKSRNSVSAFHQST